MKEFSSADLGARVFTSGIVLNTIPFFVLQCCQALMAALCLENESPTCIVPRMLFLDSYFCSHNPSEWEWPIGAKMHIMGSLILQAVFRNRNVGTTRIFFNLILL